MRPKESAGAGCLESLNPRREGTHTGAPAKAPLLVRPRASRPLSSSARPASPERTPGTRSPQGPARPSAPGPAPYSPWLRDAPTLNPEARGSLHALAPDEGRGGDAREPQAWPGPLGVPTPPSRAQRTAPPQEASAPEGTLGMHPAMSASGARSSWGPATPGDPLGYLGGTPSARGARAAAPDAPSGIPERKPTQCNAPAEAPNNMRASRRRCGACSLRQRVAPTW